LAVVRVHGILLAGAVTGPTVKGREDFDGAEAAAQVAARVLAADVDHRRRVPGRIRNVACIVESIANFLEKMSF
jgi:hypothetical protein